MTLLKSSNSLSGRAQPFDFSGGRPAPQPENSSHAEPVAKAATSAVATGKTSEDENLEARVAELEKALAEERQNRKQACEEALTEGRKAGKLEAEKQDAERLAALAKALEGAQAQAAEALEGCEAAAIQLARASLQQILGDSATAQPLVGETARHWRAGLSGKTVLRLRVSTQDFPDPAALAEMSLDFDGIDVVADTELPVGGCVFDLQLGSLDASLGVQLAAADAFLAARLPGAGGGND